MSDINDETVYDEPNVDPTEPEAVVDPVSDPAAEPDADTPATDPEADAEPVAPKTDGLVKRIGELTAKRKAETARAEEAERKYKELEARMAAAGAADSGEPTAPPHVPAAGNYEADVKAEAARIAKATEFNAKCDNVFDAGVAAHGAKFEGAVKSLNEMGIFSDTSFLEAVLETDAPADVINHLGQNPEEALRVAELSPIKRAVEMDRLARQLSTPKAAPALSKAPPPITPVAGGRPRDGVDIYAEDTSEADYYAQREAAWRKKHG